MVDFIEEFSDELHPQIKKITVANLTAQHSIKLAYAAVGSGPALQTYAPSNLDLVRWKNGNYWNDKGQWAMARAYSDEWNDKPMWFRVAHRIVDCATDNCGKPGETKEMIRVSRNPDYGLIGDPGDPASEANGNAAWLWIVDSTQNTLYSEEAQITRNAPAFPGGGAQGVSVFGNTSVGVRGKVFYDHVFELEIPHNKRNIEEAMFGSVSVSYADVKPTYNFYVGSYECIIDEPDVDERILPNMYAFLLVQQQQFGSSDVIINNDPSSIDNIFEKNVTLNGLMSGTLFATNQKGEAFTNQALVNSSIENKEQKLGKASSKGQYFDKFANVYRGFNTSSAVNINYMDKLTNLIVPQTDLSLYKDFNSKRFNFPMCVDISFSTDVSTEFAQALKQSKLSSALMKDTATGSFSSVRASGTLDYEDPNWDSRLRVPFKPAQFTKEYYKNATIDQDRPVVLVHFGTRNKPYRNPWSRDSYWTPLANIAHNTGQITSTPGHGETKGSQDEDNSFFIGDAVVIEIGHQPNIRHVAGQILAYASKAEPVSNSDGDVPPIDGLIRTWRPIVYDTSLVGNDDDAARQNVPDIGIFYPETVRHHRFAWTDRIEHPYYIYGDLTAIPSGRPQYKRAGDYKIINPVDDTITSAELKQWDITDWIKSLSSQSFTTDENKITYLGPYNQEIKAAQSNGGDTQFFRTLMTIIVAGKFSQMVKEKTRTYGEIIQGIKAYSETVFYKVEKWALNNRGEFANGKPIQSFYLPNSNEIDVHRYIDTQVKYGKRYGYKILAYQMVFGNKYRYVLNRVPTSDNSQDTIAPYFGPVNDGEAEICIFTSPSIRLIEVPYYTFKGIVMDSPPIWPHVNIMSYMKEADKVLFFFQGNVGNYKLNPITILREDSIDIDKVRDAQKTYVGPIEYKSDDQAKTFQVFRTTRVPKTYQDFSEWKLKDVEADIFEAPQPQKSATAAAFLDDITPNTKYYYMFRSVDIHNHVSNPSPVYEVEIVDNGGAPVLSTRVHPLVREKEPPQKPAKCMKKYIYITPNPVHLQVNKSESGLTTDNGKVNELPGNVIQNGPVLGVGGETIWGKKFKIRLVSKKTGKKLDFKLEFKKEHEVPTDQGDLDGGQKIC